MCWHVYVEEKLNYMSECLYIFYICHQIQDYYIYNHEKKKHFLTLTNVEDLPRSAARFCYLKEGPDS